MKHWSVSRWPGLVVAMGIGIATAWCTSSSQAIPSSAFRTQTLIVDGSASVGAQLNAVTSVTSGRVSMCSSGQDNCSGQNESFVIDTSGMETHQQISEMLSVSRGTTLLRHDHLQGSGNTGFLQLQESIVDGTVDTTLAPTQSYAIEAAAITTRSAGGNILGNVALLANASGAQENYALLSNNGDIRMNTANAATLGSTTMASFSTTGLADLSSSSAIKLSANITSTQNTIVGTSSITPQLSIGLGVTNDGTELQVKNTNTGQNDTGILVELDTTVSAARGGYLMSRGAGGGGGLGTAPTGLIMCSGVGYETGCAANNTMMFSQVPSGALVFAADATGFTTATRLTSNNHWVQDTSTGAPGLGAGCTSGGSSAIVGNDNAMKITTGATSTACTVTFAKTWTSAPICIVLGEAGATHTETFTATTVVFSANQSAKVYDVHCQGSPGST
jgi:hypothetical protein